jgi:transposase-like protein
MPKKKLSTNDALALVLSGLKGELPVSDLCRKYGVSMATYYKLRD